ncbi:MAG TPA: hypothetical protein VGQ22_06055 [Steroidobacteraceae bacterium]|jgi:hypothetical protein|nr:hypothetical protein [Steroidobacteraceae bacterium]
MQTRIATFVAGALATAFASLVPQPASAAPVTADVKAYGSDGCNPTSGFYDPWLDYYHYGLYNKSYYGSGGVARVVCPITRDAEDSTPEIQVSVYFNSMWALQPFSCTLWALSADGWTNAFQTKSDATLNSQGRMDLAIKGFAGGYYSLQCDIPQLGFLVSYSVKEF